MIKDILEKKKIININIKDDSDKEKIALSEIKELTANLEILKARTFIDALINEARKRYGLYQQRRMDLVARLSTEWPEWGIGLEFNINIILPFINNSILQHFINLSDNLDLAKTKYAIYVINSNKGVDNLEDCRLKIKAENEEVTDLVNLTVLSCIQNYDPEAGIRFSYPNLDPFLVRMLDGDIGVQALYTVMEGIIRNAAKHGEEVEKQEGLEVKVVFCEDWSIVSKLLKSPPQVTRREDYFYNLLVSCNVDTLKNAKDNGRTIKINGQDKPLDEGLNDLLDKEIIDETGRIEPTAWGFKELKIASAFVAGEGLEAVNEPNPHFIKIAKTEKLWQDGKERLVYCLKLQKPRYVLVWTYEIPDNSREFERYGIRFTTDLHTNLDYDFLYIIEGKEGDYNSLDDKEKVKLPQRVIKESQRKFKDFGNFKNKKDFENLILSLYDEWLEIMRGKKSLKNLITTIGLEGNSSSKWSSINISGLEILSTLCAKNKILRRVNSNTTNEEYIYLLHHMKLLKDSHENERIKKHLDSSCWYYQYGSGRDPFFTFLTSITPEDNSFLANLVIRQFIETAIMRILIIDERIAQSLIGKQAPEEGVALLEKLYWLGVKVTSSIKVEGDSKPFLEFVSLKENEKREYEQFIVLIIEKEGIIKNVEDIDILFIHQTKFNDIFKHLRESGIEISKEDLIRKWKEKIKFIIVHSGRGKSAGEKPENVPFLEYSTVQKYMLYEPSKFYLTQIALATKEET